MTTAFVLGGGGILGAVEVGMLRALFERDVTPDLVLGTSVGALNGAMVAREPALSVIERLTDLWLEVAGGGEVYGDRALRTLRRAVATRTHIYSPKPLTDRLADEFGDTRDRTVALRALALLERSAHGIVVVLVASLHVNPSDISWVAEYLNLSFCIYP